MRCYSQHCSEYRNIVKLASIDRVRARSGNDGVGLLQQHSADIVSGDRRLSPIMRFRITRARSIAQRKEGAA
jgi:hypothetical protein